MVIIVGAGPAGLVTALLLARQGVRVLVLERFEKSYPLPRAVHLDDECVRILQNAGVAEEFAGISRPAEGLRLLSAQHEVLAGFRRSKTVGAHGYPQANLFDQPDLEAILRRAVSREPLVELWCGVRVTGVDAGGRVHYVRTSAPGESASVAGARGGEETTTVRGGAAVRGNAAEGETIGVLAADAVIGCDGAGSLVRKAIGSHLKPLAREQNWFVVDVLGEPPRREWDGVEQICDPARPATYLRVGERRLRWEFRMRPGETAEHLATQLDHLIAPWTKGEGQQVLRTAEYTFRAAVADRWRLGRTFLVGDAAHLTPPFIGQGLGSGLRDAANLSWKLARVLRGEAGDALLDTYQAERRPHATSLIRLAVLAGGLMSRTGGPLTPLVRAAGRSAWITERVLAGTSPPLRTSALTPPAPRRRAGSSLVGTLVPQFPTPQARLDELLGPGFALLTRRAGSPAGIGEAAARLQARVVRAQPLPAAVAWLDQHGLDAVLIRPDRVVLAVG